MRMAIQTHVGTVDQNILVFAHRIQKTLAIELALVLGCRDEMGNLTTSFLGCG
jgi:hypothetical protein